MVKCMKWDSSLAPPSGLKPGQSRSRELVGGDTAAARPQFICSICRTLQWGHAGGHTSVSAHQHWQYWHGSCGNVLLLLTQTVLSVDRLHNLLDQSLGLWQPWCRPGAGLLPVSSWSISGTAANKILHIPNLQTQCWPTISSFNMWPEMRTIGPQQKWQLKFYHC